MTVRLICVLAFTIALVISSISRAVSEDRPGLAFRHHNILHPHDIFFSIELRSDDKNGQRMWRLTKLDPAEIQENIHDESEKNIQYRLIEVSNSEIYRGTFKTVSETVVVVPSVDYEGEVVVPAKSSSLITTIILREGNPKNFVNCNTLSAGFSSLNYEDQNLLLGEDTIWDMCGLIKPNISVVIPVKKPTLSKQSASDR